MKHSMKGCLVVAGISVALTIGWPVVSSSAEIAASSAASPAVSVQSFTGGGMGNAETVSGHPYWIGGYQSSGQLGVGQYVIGGRDAHAISFRRDDGTTMAGTFRDGSDCGGGNDATVGCLAADLTGTADIATAHVVIAIVLPVPDQTSWSGMLMRGTLSLRRRIGVVTVDGNAKVYTSGGVVHFGDPPTTRTTDIKLTHSAGGYWVVNAAGQVYAYGNARYLGNADRRTLAAGEIITGMAVTLTDHGYWLFTSLGSVLAFGDARFHGDLRQVGSLQGRIVAGAATATGNGYYLAGTDGGVFAFGDATFRGSMANTHLNAPVIGIVVARSGAGYWLGAADGGVFSFNVPFLQGAAEPIPYFPLPWYAAITSYHHGYAMIGAKGSITNLLHQWRPRRSFRRPAPTTRRTSRCCGRSDRIDTRQPSMGEISCRLKAPDALPLRVDALLEVGADGELRRLRRRDLDRFTGLRVHPGTRRAGDRSERTESRKRDLVTTRDRGLYGCEKRVQRAICIRLAQFRLTRNRFNEFALVHRNILRIWAPAGNLRSRS